MDAGFEVLIFGSSRTRMLVETASPNGRSSSVFVADPASFWSFRSLLSVLLGLLNTFSNPSLCLR